MQERGRLLLPTDAIIDVHMQMLSELLAAARQSNIKLSHQVAEIERQRFQESRDAQDKEEDFLDQVREAWLTCSFYRKILQQVHCHLLSQNNFRNRSCGAFQQRPQI